MRKLSGKNWSTFTIMYYFNVLQEKHCRNVNHVTTTVPHVSKVTILEASELWNLQVAVFFLRTRHDSLEGSHQMRRKIATKRFIAAYGHRLLDNLPESIHRIVLICCLFVFLCCKFYGWFYVLICMVCFLKKKTS